MTWDADGNLLSDGTRTYAYDPYGTPLQTTAPLTDFTYAGMFANADSGLLLTNYRAYDPVAGRWLSRDPIGEGSDSVANLYRYVNGDPISLTDPNGSGLIGAAIGAVVGGGLGVAYSGGQYLAGGNFDWSNVFEDLSGGLIVGAIVPDPTTPLLAAGAAIESAINYFGPAYAAGILSGAACVWLGICPQKACPSN